MIERCPLNLHDPGCDPVQKVTVMGHHHDSPPELYKILFQPLCHSTVEMIGRFIEHKYVNRYEKRASQRRPLLLASGQRVSFRVIIRKAKAVDHRLGFTLHRPFIALVHIVLQNRF